MLSEKKVLTKIYISVRYVKVIEFKIIVRKRVYFDPFSRFAAGEGVRVQEISMRVKLPDVYFGAGKVEEVK